MNNEQLLIRIADKEFRIQLNSKFKAGIMELNGQEHSFQIEKLSQETYSVLLDGKSCLISLSSAGENCYYLNWKGIEIQAVVEDERSRLINMMGGLGKSEKAVRRIKAPMPGLVVKVLAQKNAFVKKGQPLVVVEAMKMENEIPAPVEGVVTEVKVQEKQTVDKDQILAIITE